MVVNPHHRHVKGWKGSGLLKKGPFCWWDKNCLNPTTEPHFRFVYSWQYCLSCNKKHWWIVDYDHDWMPGDDQILDAGQLRAARFARKSDTTTRKVL